MRGDKITVICNDGNGPFTIEATSNGSSVEWSSDRQWVTLNQLSKAQKVVRTMKFKPEVVSAVIEEPTKPV
jgi:hypothetical protein